MTVDQTYINNIITIINSKLLSISKSYIDRRANAIDAFGIYSDITYLNIIKRELSDYVLSENTSHEYILDLEKESQKLCYNKLII